MIHNAKTAKKVLVNTEHGAEAQHGFDVTLKTLEALEGIGVVAANKTTAPSFIPLQPLKGIYRLEPGYYRITFNEGGTIPQGMAAVFKTRSSLVRCGAHIETGLYDAGFTAPAFGGFLSVFRTIKIEQNARVAQFLLIEAEDVEELYDGQWQGQ